MTTADLLQQPAEVIAAAVLATQTIATAVVKTVEAIANRRALRRLVRQEIRAALSLLPCNPLGLARRDAHHQAEETCHADCHG